MLLSTFKVTSDAGLVTPSSVGSRVLVANSNNEIATSGILRFVGELEGQDGLFCGVELPEPFGKNDGSYKGVYFFRCPQNHGLFLPIHRVRLAEKRQSHSRMPIQRPDRLIKSVFPSINTSLIGSQHSMDPQFMLQEIEDPRPLFAMDEDEFSPVHDSVPPDMFSNGNISTSYVVTNPMMDRRDLPIIGTPPVTDDLETPLVEENPINGNFIHETTTNNYAISENIFTQQEEKTATVNKTPEKIRNKSPGAKTPTVSQESTPQQQQEKREKKQRVSLREMITAAPPSKPIQVEKPKKISKQQQLMEQILNNMKEQKDVPKKEKSARPKLSDLWSQPPPPLPSAQPATKNVENDGKGY
uniref:CAP-Gly domain-containing protein n=1 Tax=Panagrolaimus sp. ES5 TaxID=591445 RepID=A0AC34FF27_9BILA